MGIEIPDENLRGLLDGFRASHCFPTKESFGVRRTLRPFGHSPVREGQRFRTAPPSPVARRNPALSVAISRSRRRETLYDRMNAPSGGGMRTATITSSGSRRVFLYPVKKPSRGSVRTPRGLRRTTLAPYATRTGEVSPIGEAVPRLPPSVARVSYLARCKEGERLGEGGIPAPEERGMSASGTPAPICDHAGGYGPTRLSSSTAPRSMTVSRFSCRFVTRSAASVAPAITVAPGYFLKRASASSSDAGTVVHLPRRTYLYGPAGERPEAGENAPSPPVKVIVRAARAGIHRRIDDRAVPRAAAEIPRESILDLRA